MDERAGASERRPARTASETAYVRLRELILTTELAPGQSLIESELMARLGVGRTPLRDALRLLSHDGLVMIEPRRGTFVAPLTHPDLHAIFEVRVAIEGVIAEAAIGRATRDDLASAHALLKKAQANPSDASDVSIDEELHELLGTISRNRFLVDFYKRLRDESLRFRYLTQSGMDTKRQQVSFLREIHKSLEERDQARLTKALVAHVDEFRERVWKALSQESSFRSGPSAGREHFQI